MRIERVLITGASSTSVYGGGVFEDGKPPRDFVTDAWKGIALILEPEREILVARHGDDVQGRTQLEVRP